MTIADIARRGKAREEALAGLPTLLIVPLPLREAYNAIGRWSITKG
jgi:hypothetical protein